ncbi:DUF262 domain-containing protein [Serratia sp. DD3]|uniref:DUF262 domain-containing protein n=1 Tax=Serratia sp. DD3 TaxID=1410619 RepID=UPI0004D452B8|nr:DUF262 domain-containing protein [Serratia sp. DD3]KEY59873.1 hypothetical protein SRDD_12120 [Serratia sp. DD3]KEY60191.1 hypothetical protein SRDD_08200 [Serratia sp. DD3]
MSDEKNNTSSGERLSFYQLFEQKNMKVEIPIIQRDYAQGRGEAQEVRETFLQALHDYLEKGEPFRDLDFVYGSVTDNVNGRDCFIPLDGQQRLTTLFLLHWYLAQISDQVESFRQVLSTGGCSHFTYETRSSSREFCNALVTNDIDFSTLLREYGAECLSKTIKDKAWFYLSWENDPTIRSMLTMLDAIHRQFSENTDYFDKLTDREYPIITFRFLNLAEFKLTDDLYIKMNARGKPLTDFENFKARLEKIIKSFTGEWPEYRLCFKDAPVSCYEYFIHKIDTDWTDLFWCYRNVATKDDTFDDELMNFIALSVANFLMLKDSRGSYILQQRLFGLGGRVNQLSLMEYEQNGDLSQQLIINLIAQLDVLQGNSTLCSGVSRYLEKNKYYDEDAIFKKIITNNSSFAEKLRFHAFYAGVGNGKMGSELLSWMRVVFNLTENTIFNTIDDYHKALLSISELAKMDGNILNLLINDVQIKGFLTVQIFEERLKAHLIMKTSEWSTAIIELECHEFFRGQIGFALKFSGIVDYFYEQGNVEWQDANESYFQKFKYYAMCGSVVFTEIGLRRSIINYAWERAVLSKGDYLTRSSANRFNLLSTRTFNNNMARDNSWRRFMRLSLQPNDSWNQQQQYVKDVLDDPAFDPSDLRGGLEAICTKALTECPFGWRFMLIAKPKLIGLSNQGFIVRTSDEVILLHQSQRNHYHSELYSKFLELELRDSRINTAPFKKIEYKSVRSGEDISFLAFNGLFLNEQEFELEISYSRNQYCLLFYRDGSSPFPYELQSTLRFCDFTVLNELEGFNQADWDCNDDNYVYYCGTPQQAFAKISELCTLLVELSDD